MSSAPQTPQLWEIWHARFDFSEGRGYKFRPVIIVGMREDGMLAMMVTSAANKRSLPHDYPIRDWEAANLEKPSIARADRIAALPAGYLGSAGRIGKLSDHDTNALKLVLSTLVQES